jgi:hypothetical protein
MAKPLRCRLGLHSYVRERHKDELPHGPNRQVCRFCGKRKNYGEGLPPGAFTGGG